MWPYPSRYPTQNAVRSHFLSHLIYKISWLIRRKSNLSIENKLLVYKAVIKPIWTYGIELWGCASKSNTAIMQRAQSKILRTITNAPWYVTNHTLHTDLNIPYVSEIINERINKHLSKLESHPNPLLETLTQTTRNRRLKRRWTSDLHDWGHIAGWCQFSELTPLSCITSMTISCSVNKIALTYKEIIFSTFANQ